MGWTIWLILGVSALALYLLGLFAYRVALNAKGLRAEISKSQELLAELEKFEQIEPAPARAAGQADLAKVLLNRRRIQKDREQRRELRQRRLVQRISEIEIDKRYQ